MRLFQGIRAGLVGLVALTAAGLSGAAQADSGTIVLNWVKGGWIIGAAAGGGTLTFHGQHYPLSVGGLSAGFTFGAAKADFSGTVSNISQPSDVAGVYGAAGAGVAAGIGAGAIVLTNEKGAVLELQGTQAGLMVNADFSGLAISLR